MVRESRSASNDDSEGAEGDGSNVARHVFSLVRGFGVRFPLFVFRTCGFQDALNAFVSLVAGVFIDWLTIRSSQSHAERPRPNPRVCVVERNRPVDVAV